MVKTLSVGLLLPLLLAGAGSDADECVRLERLSDRVLLAHWIGPDRLCHLVGIRSQKGLVLIDTEMSPRTTAPIKERFERAFGRTDWAYIINTHGHHAGGNGAFRDVPVVAHENLAAEIQWRIDTQTDPQRKRQAIDEAAQLVATLRTNVRQLGGNRVKARLIYGEIRFWELYIEDLEEGYEVLTPTVTFADRHTLDLGDVTLELIFFGKGHSNSDTLVYMPQEGLLFTGAIAYQRGQLPEIGDQSQIEDVQRSIAVLDEFLDPNRAVRRVLPSHSRPLQRKDLVPVRDYYQKMLAGVRAAQRGGLPIEQAAERLAQRKEFPAFPEPPPGHWLYGLHDRNLRNLWRLCQEESRRTEQTEPAP
ncbi:MAG TPA: MBL fold metallo-hydrolase [Sedimentisphaerales bacterium]|mgnify:CR=1 FL=1|nr:MBL fold metallo-hydrolase [Sedimentisphaerales bacterium]HRS12989.1 MBL fold metallo-hydrolase [Sedimentisphaerales bacterium]HRV49589.1 MBL fold metallo-hydrolase [Sedimentisphaerales bacterium]